MTPLHAVPDPDDLHDELKFEGGKKKRGRPKKTNATKQVFDGVEHLFKFAVSEGGNSVSVHVSHQPAIAARVEYLVENRELPYRSKADVWRDAIYWYLEFVDEWWQDGGFSKYMEVTRRRAESNHQRMMNQIEVSLVEETRDTIEELLASKNWTQLAETIPHGHHVVAQATVDTESLEKSLQRAEKEMQGR